MQIDIKQNKEEELYVFKYNPYCHRSWYYNWFLFPIFCISPTNELHLS